MATYTKEEILMEAEKLANEIKSLDEVNRYHHIETRLNDNKKLKKLINNMKSLQKQAVNFQAYGKTEALKKVDAEIDRIQEEIDAIPIVEEFKESQVIVNDVLQQLSQSITEQVEAYMEQLSEET